MLNLQTMRRKLAQWILPKESVATDALPRPAHHRYTVLPGPDFDRELLGYIQNEWVNTAIDQLAAIAVSTSLQVKDSQDNHVDHPLLRLLGPFGRPNLIQDVTVFLESHFVRMDVHGNDIWYWLSLDGGAPDEVYQLDLRRVQIRVNEGVPSYYFTAADGQYMLPKESVLHFKRSNILEASPIWGMSPLHKIQPVITSDGKMSRWSDDFFGTGVPTGILIVDKDTTKSAEDDIRQQLIDLHADKRRVAIMKSLPGSAQFIEANLAHRDLEFKDGRKLTRQAVFDALGFHTGLVSESATEAHARIAERYVRNSAYNRQRRLLSHLNMALRFWPNPENYRLQFGDVRLIDWEQENKKAQVLALALEPDKQALRDLYRDELGLT